jgi:hypothetical protein
MKTIEKRDGKIVQVWHSKECALRSKVPPMYLVEVEDNDAELVTFRVAEQTKLFQEKSKKEEYRKENKRTRTKNCRIGTTNYSTRRQIIASSVW